MPIFCQAKVAADNYVDIDAISIIMSSQS